jgi:shikimate dehydrogenase
MNDHLPTKILAGLIGDSIQASLTPRLHEQEGRAQGFDYTYELLDLHVMNADVTALPRLLSEAQERGFAGLNSRIRASRRSCHCWMNCRMKQRRLVQ